MMATNESSPILDWIDQSEESTNEAFQNAIDDDSTLRMLATGWRAVFSGAASLPAAMQQVVNPFEGVGRGGDAPGGLGPDYPIGLHHAIRAGWALTARSLAMQHAMLPGQVQRSIALNQLATTLDAIAPVEFAPTAKDTIWVADGLRLRVVSESGEGAPIVVVSSLINRWYILDYLPGMSFVTMLASLGRPVYVAEWTAPGKDADERSLGDLASGPLRAAIAEVCVRHDAARVGLVGYCMGGTLAAMFAARWPDQVERLATVAGPVYFAAGGAFRRWLGEDYLDVDLICGAFTAVPAALVHMPFWWLRPTIKMQKASRLAKSHAKPGYVERFMAAEVWNHDNMDMARGVFRTWAGELYQRDALVAGNLDVGGVNADLSQITCPVLVITGAFDTITPPESADALAEHVSSARKQHLKLRGSHTGILTHPKLLAEAKEHFEAWLQP